MIRSSTPPPAGSRKASGGWGAGEEKGTVPEVRSAEGTRYLLQQEDFLAVFGQVVAVKQPWMPAP